MSTSRRSVPQSPVGVVWDVGLRQSVKVTDTDTSEESSPWREWVGGGYVSYYQMSCPRSDPVTPFSCINNLYGVHLPGRR